MNDFDLPTDETPTRRPRRRISYGAAAIGVIAVIAAGCGSSGTKAATSNPTSAAAPAASPTGAATAAGSSTAGAANTITATLTEFKIALSRTNLTPGTYTFDAVNSGHTVHALALTGPGATSPTSTKQIQPGQSADLTVTLQAGTYDVYCPVGDHKELGMNLELTVAGSASAAAPAAAPATAAPATTAPASSTSGSGSGY